MPDSKPSADEAWAALVAAARAWALHMDQWDKFRFATDCGWVYVTIRTEEAHPDSFEEVRDAG